MDDINKKAIVPLSDAYVGENTSNEDILLKKGEKDLSLLSTMAKIAETFQIGHEIANTITSTFESFAASFTKAYDFSTDIKSLGEVLIQFATAISEAVAEIHIPSISEERKQELLANHKQWGTWGWTWFPYESINFYDVLPLSINEANKKVRPLYSPRATDFLFDDLRKKSIKKEDLEAAIFCYKNRQYKACALILFSVIDAKLIRNQPMSKNRNEWRKVGGKAIKYLDERAKESLNLQTFYIMLHYANLIACLETLFQNGGDFMQEPLTINRNFISHGMSRRSVRQRDCIQLFLLLYNLTYVLGKM